MFLNNDALENTDMSDEKKYKYHTVNLPENLAAKIEEVITSGKHGYTNVPDFVKSAVRRYLRELGYLS
jgi:Arc/MetJ-type ribon-helix-helix transcriptional regulator